MVYITGDMHGDESRLYGREWNKLKSGDTLIVCGDFGYLWQGGKAEREALEYLGSRKFTVCFLDGTHENFEKLARARETVFKGGRVHRISGNLFHMMRGQIFEIEGHRIFTFGGGESADKEVRMDDGMWWKEELPSPEEMAEGAKNLDEAGLKVDYILTHEPPSLVKSAMLLRNGVVDATNKLNGYFEEVSRSCEFKRWFFGSMHEDRVVTDKYTAVFEKIIPITK